MNAEIISRCQEKWNVAGSFLPPVCWLIMIAPPEESAINRKINTVLPNVTGDTPDISASLEKLTTNTPAMSINMSKNCSIKGGIIGFAGFYL